MEGWLVVVVAVMDFYGFMFQMRILVWEVRRKMSVREGNHCSGGPYMEDMRENGVGRGVVRYGFKWR